MPFADLCPAHCRGAGAGGDHRPVLRSPKSISGEGCSHSVKISQRNLPDSLRILQRVGLSPKRIYITAGDGSYQEVAL